MNVIFHIEGGAEKEAQFIVEAAENDMVDLAGFKTIGGIRASLYNGMPIEGAEKLA